MKEQKYKQLETLDEHYRHLLATLKEYGIQATTYAEALTQFHKLYPTEDNETVSTSKDIGEIVRRRLRSSMQTESAFLKDRDELIKEYPDQEERIRWMYDDEIRKIRRGVK